MNNFKKFGAIALLATLLAACGPDAKTEYAQVANLDKEFAPALQQIQQKIAVAQSQQNSAAVESAMSEYYTVMDNAIAKYNALNVKDAQVKAFRDQVVVVLKETTEFTKEAINFAIHPEARTEAMQQSLAQKEVEMKKAAEALQKSQNELTQKFGEEKK